MSKFVDAAELSRRLGVTVATVHAWHRRGWIPCLGLEDGLFCSTPRKWKRRCGSGLNAMGWKMIDNTPDKLLLSAREAAKALSVCERTLWSMTQPRGPIPPVRIGNRCLYSTEALRQWIIARR